MSSLPSSIAGRTLLILFCFSGFAGLIYQSIWSQYLGLTLGHAAYAQTLVLSIFMGAMAVGAWFVSRYTLSWRRLVKGYAIVELLIGVLGLVFQEIFQAYTQISQESVLPMLESETLAHLYQWVTAALLILPQTLLLGATFPLLSAGYLRITPQQDGEVLGGLYFTNSLGAALGAFVTTFMLLPALGLPGTVMTAGVVNVLVGLGAWLISHWMNEGAQAGAVARVNATPAAGNVQERGDDEILRLGRVMILATAISGATSFVYEIGWVRMLNQALGSSIHSFELMLTAFILGLAFGGLWVRRRSRGIEDPVRYVGYVQVLMGMAALLSVPVFAQSFRWVGWMMSGLSATGTGYTMFELGSALISLAVMFPAAFFAGMTLPLFTMALLRRGSGERAIGRIYAANTLGSILGVIAMVHVLIPIIGVRLGLVLAGMIDILLGLYLLRVWSPARFTPGVVTAVAGMFATLLISTQLGQVDPAVQASGVFRTGRVDTNHTIPFLKDGKTATVAIYMTGKVSGIATNGKPDAAMTPFDHRPTGDEATMIMLGLMPLTAHPAPQDVALIGWGSGLSTHTILGSSTPRHVDTVEIEKVMYDAAKAFGARVARAYDDPRSHLRIDDARTFFSIGARQYDAIVSEPSNPWVSGVANLFTVEFYQFLRRHLKEGGVLVQWLHTYEIDDPLVATMLAALVGEFPDAELYAVHDSDMIILAPRERLAAPFHDAPWHEEELAAELRRVGLGHQDAISMRRIGGGEVIRQYVRMLGAKSHSDYYPEVSLKAPETRYRKTRTNFMVQLVANGLPVLDILDCRAPLGAKADVSLDNILSENNTIGIQRTKALQIIDVLQKRHIDPSLMSSPIFDVRSMSYALSIVEQASTLDRPESISVWSNALALLAGETIGVLPAEDLRDIWQPSPAWLPDRALESDLGAGIVRAYAAAAAREPQAMLREAEAALALPGAEHFSFNAREQLLTIAMLGALGGGDPAKVKELDQRHVDNVGVSLAMIRAFLLSWADSGVPVCAARDPEMSTAAK
jgi:predicted membrane-bound spermidine synthase